MTLGAPLAEHSREWARRYHRRVGPLHRSGRCDGAPMVGGHAGPRRQQWAPWRLSPTRDELSRRDVQGPVKGGWRHVWDRRSVATSIHRSQARRGASRRDQCPEAEKPYHDASNRRGPARTAPERTPAKPSAPCTTGRCPVSELIEAMTRNAIVNGDSEATVRIAREIAASVVADRWPQLAEEFAALWQGVLAAWRGSAGGSGSARRYLYAEVAEALAIVGVPGIDESLASLSSYAVIWACNEVSTGRVEPTHQAITKAMDANTDLRDLPRALRVSLGQHVAARACAS